MGTAQLIFIMIYLLVLGALNYTKPRFSLGVVS